MTDDNWFRCSLKTGLGCVLFRFIFGKKKILARHTVGYNPKNIMAGNKGTVLITRKDPEIVDNCHNILSKMPV